MAPPFSINLFEISGKIEHIGPEQDTLLEGQGFEGVVTSHRDEASSDENDCSEAVESHQFSHGVEENHRRNSARFFDGSVSHPGRKRSFSSTGSLPF